MSDPEVENTNRERLWFLDNLRTFMILLVVLFHAAGVYENSGIWATFWLVVDPATSPVAGLLVVVFDIFVMSPLFFVSGYLAQISLGTKSPFTFIVARFRRLIIPWVIAVITLIPLYRIIFLHSRHLPQEDWTTYFHFTNCEPQAHRLVFVRRRIT